MHHVNPNLRRRRRRLLTAAGVTVLVWGSLTNLPISAQEAVPGTMHTEIITLSGSDGERVAPATDADAGLSASDSTEPQLQTVPDVAKAGWSAAVEVESGTQAVAASWIGDEAGAVSIRGEGPDGWSEWAELEADPEEQPDDSVRNPAGMAWFGRPGIDRVELRVDNGALQDLEIQPMRYEDPPGGSFFDGRPAGAAASQPAILPRSSWTSKGWASGNSGCSSGPKQASGGLQFAVVHHTVNSNTYSAADVPAMLSAIYTYHTGTNGWCDTAYNFLIDRFGRTWEGRSGGIDKAIVGGHARGFNTGSTGVAFLGQYEPGASPTAAQPTSAAIDAAGKLLGWKLDLHGLNPEGTVTVTSGGSNKYPAGTSVSLNRITGHRDIGYTACPGAHLYSQLGTIRAKAGDAVDDTTTTTTTGPPPPQYAPFYTANQLVTQQYRDVLHREPSSSDLSYWSSRVGASWSPEQFIAHLTSSNETDDRVHAVTRLYSAYFLRSPDYGGLTYWLNRRGEGRTISSISSSFAVSSEFINRYGNLSDSAFVDRVYQNVLGRSADPGGLTYWTSRLINGTPRGQVMANFSQSSEYIAQTRFSTWVIGTHEAMLQRMPTGDVSTWYEAVLANGGTTLTGITGEIYDGSEYRSRFS